MTFIKSSEVFISKKRLSLRLKREADEKHSPLNNILKFLKLKWKKKWLRALKARLSAKASEK